MLFGYRNNDIKHY